MHYVREMSVILNPLTNSYARLGAFEAPKYITWSRQKPLPADPHPGGKRRIRPHGAAQCGTPAAIPISPFALLLEAGLSGIEQGMALPASTDIDVYRADAAALKGLAKLPATMGEALDLARESALLKQVLGEKALDKFLREKACRVERLLS